jgi:hypothetical protein
MGGTSQKSNHPSTTDADHFSAGDESHYGDRPRTIQVQEDGGTPMEVTLEDRLSTTFILPSSLH